MACAVRVYDIVENERASLKRAAAIHCMCVDIRETKRRRRDASGQGAGNWDLGDPCLNCRRRGRVLFAKSLFGSALFGRSDEFSSSGLGPSLIWVVISIFNGCYFPPAFVVDVVDARFPRTCRAHEEEQCRQ